jgi:hypothetical protein
MAAQEARELSGDELAIVCGGELIVTGRGGTQPSSQPSGRALAQELKADWLRCWYAMLSQPI